MMARIVWIAVLIVVAGVTAQLQIDRQSALEPEQGEWVAAPFRAYSQEGVARTALQGGDPALALAEAQRLVERRPIPAEHLTALALAYFKSGDNAAASVAIQRAAQRGWRDPLAQEARARLALDAGDVPEATRRFTALMVLGTNNDALLNDLAAQIFAEPDSPGHETLVAIISETDRWGRLFLRRGPGVMPPDAFAKVIVTSTEQGASFDCGTFERAQRLLARRDADAGAVMATARSRHCR
jgi:tetratricopeptide (TPR) repeat protein